VGTKEKLYIFPGATYKPIQIIIFINATTMNFTDSTGKSKDPSVITMQE
jgi:hypothetical protein